MKTRPAVHTRPIGPARLLAQIAQPARARALCLLLAVLLGALPVWAAVGAQSMNPDGVAYLEMGEAWLRGDWQMAVNAYWSPLYGLALAATLALLAPAPFWEFPAIQITNYGIYLFALACFDSFWRQLMACPKARADQGLFSDWIWLALGYGMYVWSALTLIEVWAVTPDMLAAGLLYLAAGLYLRALQGDNWRAYALLGAVLGLAYLARAALFPLAFVFMAASLIVRGRLHGALPRLAATLLTFLLVSGPFITALSFKLGYPSFGESGKLNYARFVNGLPDIHWQGGPAGSGAPLHPTRQIFVDPPAFAFDGPIGGTYPAWYDPWYWYEGVTLRFEPATQLRVLAANLITYSDLFVRAQAALVAGVLTIYLIAWRRGGQNGNVRVALGLTLPALAALAVYALVYVEARYIGAFLVLLWAGLLVGAPVPVSREARELVTIVGGVMAALVVAQIGLFLLGGVRPGLAISREPVPMSAHAVAPGRPGPWVLAEELHRLGLRPGDKVANIGDSYHAFWARLARLQIIAEVPDAISFWAAPPAMQERVVQAFAATGAKAIVAARPAAVAAPGAGLAAGWQQLGTTGYSIYWLQK